MEVKINFGGAFTALLQITFIVLKLCGVIAWSWLWVLSPIWMPIALTIGLFILVGFVGFIIGVVKGIIKVIKEKKQ